MQPSRSPAVWQCSQPAICQASSAAQLQSGGFSDHVDSITGFALWEHLFSCFSYVEAGHCCGAPRTWQPTSFGTTCTTLRTWVLTSLDTSQRLRSRRWFSLRRQKKKLAEFFFDGTDVQIIETKAWITHYGHRLPC